MLAVLPVWISCKIFDLGATAESLFTLKQIRNFLKIRYLGLHVGKISAKYLKVLLRRCRLWRLPNFPPMCSILVWGKSCLLNHTYMSDEYKLYNVHYCVNRNDRKLLSTSCQISFPCTQEWFLSPGWFTTISIVFTFIYTLDYSYSFFCFKVTNYSFVDKFTIRIYIDIFQNPTAGNSSYLPVTIKATDDFNIEMMGKVFGDNNSIRKTTENTRHIEEMNG